MPRVPKILYEEVLKRDNWTCQDCGTPFTPGDKGVLLCHHIKPRSEGGPTTLENLRAQCYPCCAKRHPGFENLFKKNFRKVREDFLGSAYERCY